MLQCKCGIMEDSYMTFWDILGTVADFCGLLSLILGIITLVMAVGIKKSLIKHVEKSAYLNDIDNQIKDLKSFYDTIDKDNSLYNFELLDRIDAQLEDIYISYETILPRKLLAQISKLRNHIQKEYSKNLGDKNFQRECKKQLHCIYIRLGKEKKLL